MRFFYSREPDTNYIFQRLDFIKSITILDWRSVCFERCLPWGISLPKSPYLSGIVTYEDDQTAMFHSNFAQFHFTALKHSFGFILPPTGMMLW
jgi:hypothetical protein